MPQAKQEATAKLEQAIFADEKIKLKTLLEQFSEEAQTERLN